MTDQQAIDTLRKTIATLTRFIEAKSTPANSREKAEATREQLQSDLDRLLARLPRA